MPLFDRVKYLLLLGGVIAALFYVTWQSSPLMTPADAWAIVVGKYYLIFALMALEAIRQVHYVLAERSAAYWRAWQRLTSLLTKPWRSLRPTTRAQLGKVVFGISCYLAIGVILSYINGGSVLSAPLEALGAIWASLDRVAQLLLFLVVAVMQFVLIFWFMSRGGIDYYLPDEVKTSFSDVWGQDHVVSQVQEVVTFLEQPEEIEARGGYVPSGILLYGPPGTGKTLIAEAIAGETGLPYVFVDPGAFTNMFLGVGVLKVRVLYRKLRKFSLRYGGVVVFFDEADVLGNRGGTVSSQASARRSPACLADSPLLETLADAHKVVAAPSGRSGDTSTLNALLAEMNGLRKPRGLMNKVRRALSMRPASPPRYRILHIMATNMPDSLDAALLRPGRMDRKFAVGYPSMEGRKRTFEGYLAKVRHNITPDQVALLARNMPGATGAVIKDIVNEALISAMREDRDVITWPDILLAKDVKTNGLPDNFVYVDRERHATAVHEACHAVTAYHLYRELMRIDTVTIEPRGPVGGFVVPMPTEDRKFEWKSGLESRACVSLASLAGERFFFAGDSSVGVGSDLVSATTVALAIEGKFGMGSTVSSYDTLIERLGMYSSEPLSLQSTLAGRVEARLQSIYQTADSLVQEHATTILCLAHALELHKTLDGEDVVAVIECREGPLVDGSAYSSPLVRENLWKYHEVLLQAHVKGQVTEVAVPTLDNLREGQHGSSGAHTEEA